MLLKAVPKLSLMGCATQVPSPFNLWMNIPWTQDPKPCGSLGVIPPVSKPGDYIVLRAEMDCIVAFSACPQVVFQAPRCHLHDNSYPRTDLAEWDKSARLSVAGCVHPTSLS